MHDAACRLRVQTGEVAWMGETESGDYQRQIQVCAPSMAGDRAVWILLCGFCNCHCLLAFCTHAVDLDGLGAYVEPQLLGLRH